MDSTGRPPHDVGQGSGGANSQDTVQASNGITQITFNRTGFATGLPDGTVITIHDSTANKAYTRCLQITAVGKMTTQTNHTDATCQ